MEMFSESVRNESKRKFTGTKKVCETVERKTISKS